MIQLQPLQGQGSPFFSLDHRLIEIAVGAIKIFQVVTDEHPRVYTDRKTNRLYIEFQYKGHRLANAALQSNKHSVYLAFTRK